LCWLDIWQIDSIERKQKNSLTVSVIWLIRLYEKRKNVQNKSNSPLLPSPSITAMKKVATIRAARR
jgi:hypothetical protein